MDLSILSLDVTPILFHGLWWGKGLAAGKAVPSGSELPLPVGKQFPLYKRAAFGIIWPSKHSFGIRRQLRGFFFSIRVPGLTGLVNLIFDSHTRSSYPQFLLGGVTVVCRHCHYYQAPILQRPNIGASR